MPTIRAMADPLRDPTLGLVDPVIWDFGEEGKKRDDGAPITGTFLID